MRSRLVLVVLTCALVAPLAPAAQAQPPGRAPGQIPNSWIVQLQATENPNRSSQMAESYGGRAELVFSRVLRGFSFRGSERAAERLRRDPRVLSVEPDFEVQAAQEYLPAGTARIRAFHRTAANAFSSGYRGAGMRIAVLDTGVTLNHPDLRVATSLGRNCVSSGSPADDNGHGTHVAGVAAAIANNGRGVIGVSSSATIVPIKVLDRNGSGSWSRLICGVDHVTSLAQSSDPSRRVHVANVSIAGAGSAGSSCSANALRQAICRSVAAGVVYTTAAGNHRRNAAGYVPGAFPEVINVSAYADYDGEPGARAGCVTRYGCDDTLSTFTNFGSAINVTAPGVRVLSLTRSGGVAYGHGTSQAAPHVAGVAALMKAANPSLSPTQIRNLILQTGECPNGTQNGRSGPCSNKGQWRNDPDGVAEPLVNALRAAQAAAGASSGGGSDPDPNPPPSTPPPSSGGRIFFQNFDGSVSGWAANGLWHLTNNSTCVSPSATSLPRAVYYGRSATCNYNTGSRTAGVLVSPQITGLASTATLRFSHWRQVERSNTTRDRTYVQISEDGGRNWRLVWYQDARDASQSAWQRPSVALNPRSSSVRLRFVFDSVNGVSNSFRGWFIDDVEVLN